MTTLTIHADCGTAPKRVTLRNLHIAFAQADVEGILPYSTIDIRREIVGEVDLIGMESVCMAL